MNQIYHHGRPTIGVLAGWQFYRTATNIGYLVPIFKGINRAAELLGCNILLGCGMGASASPADPPRPAWPAPAPDVDFVPIGPWNTDGIIIFAPLHSAERSKYVQNLIAVGHPVLFIGSGEDGPAIVADNSGGIVKAVEHLHQHGHRQIAFIAGSPDDLAGDTGERLRAFRSTLVQHNLEHNPRLEAFGRHVYDGGYSAIQQIMASGSPFTAVMASNDESALGAMQALKDAGRRIPEDVAIIGFDNRLEGAAQKPSLTSIHVPLFNMGYQAGEYLFQHIAGKAALPRVIRMDTILAIRESCGCGSHKIQPGWSASAPTSPTADLSLRRSQWGRSIADTILSSAQNLGEKECLAFCMRLIDAFNLSIEHNDGAGFLDTLVEVLQYTMQVGDNAHIWQDAVSLLGINFKSLDNLASPASHLADGILDQARIEISAHMQRQHRQYISDQRQVSSRLSLLTASLLTVLDEAQIYEILARHLPLMDIQMALVALFEEAESDPLACYTIRNVLEPIQEAARFSSYEFPPSGFFPTSQPFHLVMIPLTDRVGQKGFMIFGTEHIDEYGAIVQQLGGALNTARLYRQATEGRRMAEEANRMKSRFLSSISHELRTPLNLIVGLSGIVLKSSDEGATPLPETTHKDVERIHTYSQHLGGLIGDVIDLATSDAGQLRLNSDYIELGKVLHIVAESGSQLASDKGLTWEANLPDEGPWVWGDPTRLRQVALNMINNAIKFTNQGGVSMRLETHPGSVTILVSDTGLGISEDEQQVIFNEFRQSERSIALGYGGLGLGLAISKRLVEMHGGSIGVQSSGQEGAGSTFYFSLPTVQAPGIKVGLVKPPSKTKQNVMVMTNTPDSSERLCQQLSQRGFIVHVTALETRTAWQTQLLHSLPDVILLDMSTASNVGWDVLRAIKVSQLARKIPVMFYKSSQDDGTVLELDYLTKPIELAELTQALDQQWLLANVDRTTRTILVVDDEPNTLDMHARIVQSQSSSNMVSKAPNGLAALDILENETIDLVLLDLQMPEMDGFTVLERMRENERMCAIPVIVVTGKVLTETDMERLNRGVATVLEKGLFSLDETVAHISTALEHKRRLSGEAQRLVRKAMAFIHAHFSESISRRDIAQHVNIAEDHLTFCFRQELGTTPIEYIQRYRVNQAKRLLKDSESAITEIALDVGFSDSGYFSRIFRRITGMSPEAYRRSSS